MLITMTSVRGSPGVSSWSLLLASAWPADQGVERVVVEADLDGGVYGARYRLGVDPGVVSLIAGMRRSMPKLLPVGEHGRLVGADLWVVPGPESAEQARRVWTGSAAPVAEILDYDPRVWFADVGRVSDGDVGLGFVDASALTVVFTRGAGEDLIQVPSRVEALHRRTASVAVVVVGKTDYPLEELVAFFGTELVWLVGASDDLPSMVGLVLAGGRARRSWLWRSAVELAARVAEVTGPVEQDPQPRESSRTVRGLG